MFAIVDIEATGGSPETGRIMEIAVITHNGERVTEEFSTLINPERTIDSFVVALTGISNEMVESAPTFSEIAPKLLELTKGKIIVAHNARFDYGFLKSEFKRLGVRFQRRNLCTVNMSRKLLPGHSSYSLGKLCQDLDIPIKNRHRALGDAAATTVLLERLIFSDKKQLVTELLQDELNEASLPPNLSKSVVDNLPEEIGVYYFLDENGKAIYIGKSKNIRKRVLTHFANDVKSAKALSMKSKIYDIDFQLTGNELLAEIIESGEIKRFMPEFNFAQRRKKYRYGLFVSEDENGYDHLSVGMLKPELNAVLKFTTKRRAEISLKELKERNHLNQNNRLNLSPEQYNELVNQSIEHFIFEEPNILIIGNGRDYFEQTIIQIKGGRYFGYGFFNKEENLIDQVEELKSFVKQDYNSPDKEQIIRKHLRKKNSLKLIPYHDEK